MFVVDMRPKVSQSVRHLLFHSNNMSHRLIVSDMFHSDNMSERDWARSTSASLNQAEPNIHNIGIPCVKCVSFGLSL